MSVNARTLGNEDEESTNRFNNSAKKSIEKKSQQQILINKNFSIEKRKQSQSKEKYSRNNAL